MNCYCTESDSQFTFCVEGVQDPPLETAIEHMGWTNSDGRLLLPYPLEAFDNQQEKALIQDNFKRSGQAMFEASLAGIDWRTPLAMIAEAFNKNGIEWYIVGSVGDALRGINVSPFDIDLVVFTGDFARVKATCYQNFPDSIIAPFTEHGYINPLKYFGRMFLAGAMVEIASDRIWDMDSRAQGFGRFVSPISGYESASWQGYAVNLEAVELRRQIEIARGRPDRVAAIEAFMEG